MCWARLPLNSDGDLSSGEVQGVEPALHEKSPLEAKGSDEEVESHSTKAVALEEGHEEAESNKDHHMDVLETWEEREINPLIKNIHRDFFFLIVTSYIFLPWYS